MAVQWDQVKRDDVVRAIQEYDRLGPEASRPAEVARVVPGSAGH
jgi:hypothetical protein